MVCKLGNTLAISVAFAALLGAQAVAQTTVTIGIGTQDTTTNTVTTGTIVRELKLFEKHLPKDGKYANIKFQLDWNNFTSGPPVTNGMMANKLQFGMMGDYPLFFISDTAPTEMYTLTLHDALPI